MCVCVNCNSSSSTQSWICLNCVSDLLPFNYIIDDEEFCLTLYCYFNLTKQIDISKFQSLKINPLTINTIKLNELENHEDPISVQDNFDLNNLCQYMFSEDFNKKYVSYDSQDFSLLHLNARSLPKNVDQFKDLISSLGYNFDIMAISETWFNSNTNVNMYNVPNYSLVHLCRTEKIGGGVALYINDELQYVLRNDLSCITNNYEIMKL